MQKLWLNFLFIVLVVVKIAKLLLGDEHQKLSMAPFTATTTPSLSQIIIHTPNHRLYASHIR